MSGLKLAALVWKLLAEEQDAEDGGVEETWSAESGPEGPPLEGRPLKDVFAPEPPRRAYSFAQFVDGVGRRRSAAEELRQQGSSSLLPGAYRLCFRGKREDTRHEHILEPLCEWRA
ncbi:hypothetical protein GN956_G7771 [Arapaima gigas]